jgi:hypothetical protein
MAQGKGISMNGSYPWFCEAAATNDELFKTFRQNPTYTPILEHLTWYQGFEYISYTPPELLAQMEEISKNDLYGSPVVGDYAGWGIVSPTTLRYAKVLSDIQKILEGAKDSTICEIGIGYGGQCRLIDRFLPIAEYELVDLPEVLMLAKKYLNKYNTKANLKFSAMGALEAKDRDLVISNYAFSELSRDIQDVYMENIILRAKKGYITISDGSNPPEYNSYSVQDLLNTIKGSKIVAEKPLTHHKNCIIVW